MSTIRIRRKIENETLTLPELRPLIGKTVDITVSDETDVLCSASDEFWNPPTLEELIARHNAKPKPPSNGYKFTAADFEGFDEALVEWRKEGKRDESAGDEP